MKKIIAIILCFLFLPLSFSALAAEEETKEPTAVVVYATDNVNIRTEPSTESEVITVLKTGSPITRVGEVRDGWSVVLYEGEKRYIKSEYLAEKSQGDTKPTAQKPPEETTEDNSTPRFMVTDYECSSLSPDKTAELKVYFRNYSSTKALYNIKLSLQDTSGEILTVGMPTEYVSFISADGTYTWAVELRAANTAQIGAHDLQVSAEYEDKNFGSYSTSDTVRVDVKQSVKLTFDGATLPSKVVQGETQTVTLNLMNTGKSALYNCKIDFDIKGLQAGGSVFVGEIGAGQSASGSGNLRVSSDILGAVKGTIKISYEDAYGKTYEKTAEVSTVIEEKVEVFAEKEKEEEKKNPLWWLFILIGLAVGGAVGFGVPWFINDKKQRKEDNLRL